MLFGHTVSYQRLLGDSCRSNHRVSQRKLERSLQNQHIVQELRLRRQLANFPYLL